MSERSKKLNEEFFLMIKHFKKGYGVSNHIPCCTLMKEELELSPRERVFRVSVGGLHVVKGYSPTIASDSKWCKCCPYCGSRVKIFHLGPKKIVMRDLKSLYGKNLRTATVAGLVIPA